MTLLEVAAKNYPNKVAIIDDKRTITYVELLSESNQLASYYYHHCQLGAGSRIGILSRNHISLIQSIFAASRVGADLYLLNTERSKEQMQEFMSVQKLDALIMDAEFDSMIDADYAGITILSEESKNNKTEKLPRASTGKIILQTGGTTGKPKQAGHKPSIFNYINPFLALIKRLNLTDYQTAFISTPIFHGYGIAVLLLFIPLGKKCIITSRFQVERASCLIQQHHVEFMTVVPVMLDRMLKTNVKALESLRCIASGGAWLSPSLVHHTEKSLGSVLNNLYGTSEAGLNIIATPEDLKYSPETLGKKINGVNLKILDGDYQEVSSGVIGEICVKGNLSDPRNNNNWVRTGDLGYQDEHGYFFLCGRSDDMIISGGENVFPFDIEKVLLEHPDIRDAAVIGMEDEEFGQRLKAFVKTTALSEHTILEWLRPRVARYQIPKEIVIVEDIPYTPVGKPDKKKLI
jgi:fatty-acyl-CoA synthase